jgi:hypothetical protein
MERVYSFIFTLYGASLTSDMVPSEVRRRPALSGTQLGLPAHSRDSPSVSISPPRMGILPTTLDTPSCLCVSARSVPTLPHIPHRLVVVSGVVVSVPPRPLSGGTVLRVTYGTQGGS